MQNPGLLKRMSDLTGVMYCLDSSDDVKRRKVSMTEGKPVVDGGDTSAGEDVQGEDDLEPVFTAKHVDAVLKEMWKLAQTYSVRAPGLVGGRTGP